MFRRFLFSRIWFPAQDHAVLVLLLNLVGFFISIWPCWSGENILYHSCTSFEGAFRGSQPLNIFTWFIGAGGVRSLKDETQNGERNANRSKEISVNCKFKLNKISIWSCTARHFGIQIQSKSQFDFVPWDTEIFDFLDFDYKNSPSFRISICISFTLSSLLFHGTGCSKPTL